MTDEKSHLTFNETNIDEQHGDNIFHWKKAEAAKISTLDVHIQSKHADMILKTEMMCRMAQSRAIEEANDEYDQYLFKRQVEADKEALREEILMEMQKEKESIEDSDLTPEEKQKAKIAGAKKRIKDLLGN